MHLESGNIVAAVLAAQEVIPQPSVYSADGDWEGHASVDAIFEYVQAKFKKPIVGKDVSFKGVYVGGRLERYKDHAEIALRADQDDRWKRFVTVKELLHLLIDKEHHFCPYGDQMIEALLQRGLIGLASETQHPNSPPAQSELIAEIAAIEVMYPIDRRSKDLENSKGQPLPVRRVALERQMPEFYVATALHIQYTDYILAACEEIMAKSS